MLQKMCPSCRKVYEDAWAERILKTMARMGEVEYGSGDQKS
jgi:hypothetical protein